MRKLFFSVVLILLCLFSASQTFAYGESARYLRVINESTPLYADSELNNFVFNLPYTYYVKVLGETDTAVHVECYGNSFAPALDGYVPAGLLFDDGLAVENPYAEFSLTTSAAAPLFKDETLTEVSRYVFENRELYYYGNVTAENGERAYYVCYNGAAGYVEEKYIEPFTFSFHPNELTFIKAVSAELDVEADAPQVKTDEQTVLRVIIIVTIILSGIIAALSSFRPKKKRETSDYYEENDYR